MNRKNSPIFVVDSRNLYFGDITRLIKIIKHNHSNYKHCKIYIYITDTLDFIARKRSDIGFIGNFKNVIDLTGNYSVIFVTDINMESHINARIKIVTPLCLKDFVTQNTTKNSTTNLKRRVEKLESDIKELQRFKNYILALALRY